MNDEDPSYSDNFLLNFHNQAQDEKQTETNSLKLWNEELAKEQLSVKEWQDAFARNGLADFTPPMSAGLNCLMVGAPATEDNGTKLPWEDEAEATITPLRIPEKTSTTKVMDMIDTMPIEDAIVLSDDSSRKEKSSSSNMILSTDEPSDIIVSTSHSSPKSSASSKNNQATLSKASQTPAASYDCIVDHGLLDSVVALSSSADADKKQGVVQELLVEAATALREFGIYVYVSAEPLSVETRQTLQEASELAGLEWQFELDGLLECGEVVSVARRYNNGVLPSVGKLSRFQV
ncbi:unnamed protein product [Cylindrotheca closterium]|uniref:Uncharacterized protein n=1 Tax=Cylindrotheca closterium TaxID=2856 RepID=A0AAD2FP04_9STRA|nr:unnamed protein product [Cylindrotheca closterium]